MSGDNKQPEIGMIGMPPYEKGLKRAMMTAVAADIGIGHLRTCDHVLPDFDMECKPDNVDRIKKIYVVASDASPELIASLQKEPNVIVLVEGTPEADHIMRTLPKQKPFTITQPRALVPKMPPEYNNRKHKRAKLKPKGKKKYGL